MDDKIAEFTDDEKTLKYEIELRRFVKEIIRKIDNITKQRGYEPPSTAAATGTVQKVETGERAKFTLYNVCLVHRGMFSTWRCSVHRGDTMSTSGGVQYIGGIP